MRGKPRTLAVALGAGMLVLLTTAGSVSANPVDLTDAQMDSATAGKTAPITPATTFHGAPGNTPGFGGSSANPPGRGIGVNGGAGIHNIAGNPGQSGNKPEPGNRGQPARNMHGGLNVGVHGG